MPDLTSGASFTSDNRPPDATPTSNDLDPADFITIAIVAKPRGLRGEVKCSLESDFPARLKDHKQLMWHKGPHKLSVTVSHVRVSGAVAFLTIDGVNSRAEAEGFVGGRLGVMRSELPEIADGEYYWVDLVGCAVCSTTGVVLGTCHDVLRLPAQDVLVVIDQANQETLVPFVDAIVNSIDLARRMIIIDPPRGMFSNSADDED